MLEFELYVPVFGRPPVDFPGDARKIRLRKWVGGVTCFPQETERGRVTGGPMFKDKIVILRVLTEDLGAPRWFQPLRQEPALAQGNFLITARAVRPSFPLSSKQRAKGGDGTGNPPCVASRELPPPPPVNIRHSKRTES